MNSTLQLAAYLEKNLQICSPKLKNAASLQILEAGWRGTGLQIEDLQPGWTCSPPTPCLLQPLSSNAMDFSQLQDALASKSYDKIADICDELMLQVASKGVDFQVEWPYAVHLLGHIYANDLNSARFLWKSIPNGIKESRPEIVAVWKIGQCLWTRDYSGVYVAVHGFEWSPEVVGIVTAFSENYTKRMFQLLQSAYSTITVADTGHFMGMSQDDATSYALQHGWTLDPSSKMLTVKKTTVVAEQKLDPSKLQRLTEYVFHLEH